MKCHFDYNPYNDNLIPCKEAGLKFSKGEILQIVNREDPNWWQVRARKATSLESCFVLLLVLIQCSLVIFGSCNGLT